MTMIVKTGILPSYKDCNRLVIYVPPHANGDTDHKDCKPGFLLQIDPVNKSALVSYIDGADRTRYADLIWAKAVPALEATPGRDVDDIRGELKATAQDAAVVAALISDSVGKDVGTLHLEIAQAVLDRRVRYDLCDGCDIPMQNVIAITCINDGCPNRNLVEVSNVKPLQP